MKDKRIIKNKDKKSRKDMSSNFDVGGAYTGTPAYGNDEVPTQDADDLQAKNTVYALISSF